MSLFTILREKYLWTALMVFAGVGLLGFTTFNLPVEEPLLPLLSGLFGGSGLILSIVQRTKIPQQKPLSFKDIDLSRKDYGKAVLGTVASAPLCSFLPAIGSGHAATISSELIPQSRNGFLVMIGAINLVVMVLSFATLYTLDKTRTGAAAAVQEILTDFTRRDLFIIVGAALVLTVVAVCIGLYLTAGFIRVIERVNYQLLSAIMLCMLIGAIIFFSNFLGILVFITATALGIFAVLSHIRRINLMGVLLVPTILFYLIT